MSGGVTIKLLQKPKGESDPPTTYNGDPTGTKKIRVTRHEELSGFYKYTHADNTDPGSPLELENIQDENGNIDISLQGDKKVTSVEAYYWKHENGGSYTPSKLLLIGITISGHPTKYYAKDNSGGTGWIEQLNGDLENVLDQQSCYSNDAVTLDLTKDAYTGQPCCDGHKDSSRITVQDVPVNNNHDHDHKHMGSKNLTVKKYSIKHGQLAAIKLPGEKTRRSITFSGQPFPMKGPVEISALYSGNNKEPVLIYINDKSDTKNSGWYKSGGNADTWTEAPELSDVTPENITECANWNSLVKGLKDSDSGLQECQEHLKKQESQTGEPGSQRSSGSEGVPGNPGALGPKGVKGPGEDESTDLGSRKNPGEKGYKGEAKKDEEKSGTVGASGSGQRSGESGGLFDSFAIAKLVPGGVDTTHSGRPPQQPDGSSDQLTTQAGDPQSEGGAPTAKATLTKVAPSTSATEETPQSPDTTPEDTASASNPVTGAEPAQAEKLIAGPTVAATSLAMSWGSISGISSGTLTGTAATFFAGWKLYNRFKGDPWVIQVYLKDAKEYHIEYA
ncbi:hypothetical protein BEWA_022860 [Theileria equi strain WA]|uniref:Uncharacterized protein n=1 Tax=Theileria equi strain WA TaxID=1537102 RepID=L0AW36_THEEQ|nr:hypothetical protein BEWA_022860 [Theileria equi strain WA]AFZ79438.1 hypothetical protein BEWA_022860 [Theileria equi strain WA]|eukprot:XP_004829104.1 hypothetical protein BEWA_022860 [Theileria equi strain WA]